MLINEYEYLYILLQMGAFFNKAKPGNALLVKINHIYPNK